MMRPSRLAALFPILFLMACGTPAGLDRAMTGFAEAAAKNEQALKDLDRSSSERLTRIRRGQAISEKIGDKRALVRGRDRADCTFDGTACRLTLKTSPTDRGVPLKIPSLIPNQLAIAHEITQYADGLKQIAAADNTEKVRKGAESATGSVCGLAGTLAVINPAAVAAKPACDAFSVPVVSLVAFLYGEYQERIKLSAMRQATREMHPVLEQVPKVFAASAEFSADGLVRNMVNAYGIAKGGWDGNRNEQNLAKLLEAAEDLDGALKVRAAEKSGSSVFNEFVTAHAALTDALAHGDTDLSSALGAVSRLLEKTNQLAAIAAGFSAAAKAVKAGSGQERTNP